MDERAVGILEVYGLVCAFLAADAGCKAANVTLELIIAQRVASVEDSDLILIMDGGKIAAMGKHEDLLANNKIYQEVYYSQNRMGASAADLAKTEGGAKGTAFEGKGGDRA